MNDHELTVLVEAAAEGAVNSQAASHGTTAWADLDGGMKNQVRERALPFIFHGMNRLHDLGYSKPRVIETTEELDTLRFQAVVIDSYGTPYVCERHATNGTRNEWQQAGTSHLAESDEISEHGPFTVAYEGTH